VDTDAFNQSIIQGGNAVINQVDMTMVGGSLSQVSVGEDDLS
jgi:O-antigen/teichoic acid export membrane protein